MKVGVSIMIDNFSLAIVNQDVSELKIGKVIEFVNKAIQYFMNRNIVIQIGEKNSFIRISDVDINEVSELKSKLEELKKLAKEFDKDLEIELRVKM